MAGLQDVFKNDVAKGIAIGLGVAAAGVLLAPAFRPVTRAALKSGILLFEKGREWMAETTEQFEDMVAEVRAELAEESMEAEDIVEAAEDMVAEPMEANA